MVRIVLKNTNIQTYPDILFLISIKRKINEKRKGLKNGLLVFFEHLAPRQIEIEFQIVADRV